MPIYEYRCEACAHLFDVLQKLSDAPLKECPECGAPELRRLVSAPSFRLKGGGWYETDFKSEKERKRNLAERSDGEGKSEKSGEKSDAASGDKDAGTRGDKGVTGDKSDKSDRVDKGEKGEKGDKGEKKSKPKDDKKGSSNKGTDAVA